MPDDQLSARKPTASLAEQAYTRLRTAILRGDLPLGAPLSRRKLAEEFRVSPLPIAEALQRLEAEGLVESKPRVGTRVRVPTSEEIRGHYVVREALETQSARLFAENADPSARTELKEMASRLDEMYDLLSRGGLTHQQVYEVRGYHVRLHQRIAEAGGCRALSEAIDRNQILVFNWLYDLAIDRSTLPTAWHSQLAEVLCAAGASTASEAMRRHVTYGREDMLTRMDELFSRQAELRAALSTAPGR